MMERINTNWCQRFEGEVFQANDIAVGILNALMGGFQVDIKDSNPRGLKTVPTWHVFFRGVRVLALDVNKGGILCRMLKMSYWPNNIKLHQGFRWEDWNNGKTANISLKDKNAASRLRPKLEKHLSILESVISGKCSELKKPRLDKLHLKEQYFETEVAKNLKYIEPGLSLVRRQLVTSAGRLDLLCKDEQGSPIILELKISGKDTSVLKQVNRYVEFIESETGMETRGIIVVKDNVGVDELRATSAGGKIQIKSWKLFVA